MLKSTLKLTSVDDTKTKMSELAETILTSTKKTGDCQRLQGYHLHREGKMC